VHYLPASPARDRRRREIVGSCGWYDYSLAPPWLLSTIDSKALAAKQFGGVMWKDALCIAFRDRAGELMGDVEVARTMEKELKAQIDLVADRADVKEVIVATHHQPFYEVVNRTGTLPWEYFNAFMGSTGSARSSRALRR